MKLRLWLPIVLVDLVIIAAGCAFAWWKDLPIWAGAIIGVVAIAFNKWLLRWEDDQPGGFNNP
ncbi:MAG: hypothetical protein JO256_08505 [Alphaproteobacteria bacterium]|nr:hypothetical protein [Alphaproteobacteria bacterium]